MAAQRRVYDHLDWWQVDEWAHSDAWSFIRDEAALLIAPLDIGEADLIERTCAKTAWVRWCAVADGRSASERLRAMFADAASRLHACGLEAVWAIVHASGWLLPHLHDAGFETVDRMLTFEIHDRDVRRSASPRTHVVVCDGSFSDLAAVSALDASAFEEPWCYPAPILRRALEQSSSFTLAEHDGRAVGYQCAVMSDGHAHIVRLAVREDARGRGIGATLLADAVRRLARAGATTITLNTQGANRAAQSLYRRLGFKELAERPLVLRKWLRATSDIPVALGAMA
jgi:ribosomal-protein-alanine N-acetyltransferase